MAARLPYDPVQRDRLIVEKGGLYSFLKLAWHLLEPAEFIPGWHLEEMCKHLEAVSRGECLELIINIPPGMGKSSSVSVFWQVWDWIKKPERRWMFSSFDSSLVQRDALAVKRIINSDWFQERWGVKADRKALRKLGIRPVRIVRESEDMQNSASIFWTSEGGRRFSSSVGGKATGWHADIQVVDDPTKPEDIKKGGDEATRALDATWTWYKGTMASRRTSGKFARVLIMQRLHTEDLAGKLLKEGTWTHLCFPMNFNPKKKCTTKWGGDRRTAEGELLCAARYDKEAVEKMRKDLGPQHAAAQLDQEPTPTGGQIFQRSWMNKRWRALPARVELIQSWDCAFKDTLSSDWAVGQVWGCHQADLFLVDEARGQWDLPTLCQAVLDWRAKWPKARRILIEDKANGPAVEQTLRKKLGGIVLITPQGGKVSRANASTPYYEAGNVWLPDESVYPWVAEHVEELCGFPTFSHDDRVDAATQAVIFFTSPKRSRIREMMENIKNGRTLGQS